MDEAAVARFVTVSISLVMTFVSKADRCQDVVCGTKFVRFADAVVIDVGPQQQREKQRVAAVYRGSLLPRQRVFRQRNQSARSVACARQRLSPYQLTAAIDTPIIIRIPSEERDTG